MKKTNHIKRVPTLPPRPADGHKGTFGRVLAISGSVGMAGAPSLVGNAALRSGAGLATIAVPEPILSIVAGLCPCATTIPLPANKSGQIKPAAAARMLRDRGWVGPKEKTNPPDALVIGPGLGTGSHDYADNLWGLIDAFRIKSKVPTVIDADALNLAALLPNGWDRRPHPRTIITPHPGELARMLGKPIREIQADREAIAVDTARRLNSATDSVATGGSSARVGSGATGGSSARVGSGATGGSSARVGTGGQAASGTAERAVVVLKGAGTVVTDGESVYVNTTGNAGMATGGSGDVLSGILAALLGQGMSTLDAAIFGVYLHGLAGDFAARDLGQVSMIATDIIACLPEAFRASLAKPAQARLGKGKSR